MRRIARQHETLRTQAGVQAENYTDFRVRERVMTADGFPGRVEAVHDGPYPGAEEYDVKLDGGMGGGIYTASQLKKMADEEYTATKDYPELAEILSERPDPGKQVVLAKKTAVTRSGREAKETRDHMDAQMRERGHDMDWSGVDLNAKGQSGHYVGECKNCGHSAVAGDNWSSSRGHVTTDARHSTCAGPGTAWQTEMVHDLMHQRLNDAVGEFGQNVKNEQDKQWLRDQGIEARKTASTLPDDHPDKIWLRFGRWPDDERSQNNVTGWKEDGVSTYDLDHNGEPMDPDPHLSRGHEHDESCEPDCDLDAYNDDYGNDTKEEMQGRTYRAEKARRSGAYDHPDDGHLVKGTMVGIGHDGEPLLNNVRRVGDWIDHRHLFVPTAKPHRLARHPEDEDYEPPEELPHKQATTINDVKIDDHGDAPDELRADNPNAYDKKSTEGDPDPKMNKPLTKRDGEGARGGELAKAPGGVSFEGAMSPAAIDHIKDVEDAKRDVVDQHRQENDRDRTDVADVQRVEDPAYAKYLDRLSSLIVRADWDDPEDGLNHNRPWDNGGHEDHSTGWMDPEYGNVYDQHLVEPETDHGCYIHHEGPCPRPISTAKRRKASLHVAMPSQVHPHPEGFTSSVEPNDNSEYWHYGAQRLGTHVLHGFINGHHIGTIHYSPSDDGKALKVEMLHATDRGRGAASAMMDALYEHHPHSWINHGYRTDEGLRWWNSYKDPAPERNVHEAHPDEGWHQYFNPHHVAADMYKNYSNDDNHYPPEFNAEDYDDSGSDLEGSHWSGAEAQRNGENYTPHRSHYDDDEDDDDKEEKEPEEKKKEEDIYSPDPRHNALSHGTSVYLHPVDHAIVHNPHLPTEVRANHLMHAIGHGNLPRGNWRDSFGPASYNATQHAATYSENGGGTHPHTEVTFHIAPIHHDEIFDDDGDPHFETDPMQGSVHFHSPYGDASPIHASLKGMAWVQHGGDNPPEYHDFSHEEHGTGRTVALKPDTERLHNERRNMGPAVLHQQRYEGHPDWYKDLLENEKKNRPNPPVAPGFGEQKKLFGSLESDGCYYKHDGPCPSFEHHKTAMPSKYHSEPEGFNYRVEPTGSRYPGASTHALYGFVGPHHVGTLHFSKSDDSRAVKVDMLHSHDKIPGVKGVGSAMMDALYHEHPDAWINHGERTNEGRRWWASYQDPAPERNVHNHHPSSGWDQYFHPTRVALDRSDNYIADPENNSIAPMNLENYPPPERDENGTPIDIHGPHWSEHHHAQGHDGERIWDDDDISVHARRTDDEGDDLDDTLFPGGDASDRWFEKPQSIGFDLPGQGGRTIDDSERKEEAVQHNGEFPKKDHALFSENAKAAHLILPEHQDETALRDHLLNHHGFSNDQLVNQVDPGQGDAMAMAHAMEHEHDPVSTDFGAGEIEETRVPHSHEDDPHSGGGRWVQRTDLIPSGPGFHSLNRLSDPYELVATAATDAELRFHFTASWADVRNKAKRIRTEGKVRVTLATEGMVIGEVQGDHNTYESGIQRLPGQRLSVSGWSCGCKWGAYHWGAADDFSRFAGRMCSHALALQYEAQSRGMFGNVVEIDKTRPDWVPPRVVVKHDIDSGQNRLVRSSAKHAGEMRPVDIFAFFAMHQEGESTSGIRMLLTTAGLVEGAANDAWGEPTVETPPKPYGATSPPNPYESPASAGPLTAPDPDSWGHLDPSGMLVSSTLHDEPEAALPSTDGDLEGADLEPENPSIMTMGQAMEVSRQIMLKAERERIELAEREANQVGGGDEDMDDAQPQSDAEDDLDAIAKFQASAAAKALMNGEGGSGGGYSDSDIATRAMQTLALKAFSPAEQQALINEGMDVQASNLDRLDIAGTHYADQDDDEGDSWMI